MSSANRGEGQAGPSAEIREQEFDVTGGASQAARTNATRLGPGESRTFWIHAAKTLLIVEDPNA